MRTHRHNEVARNARSWDAWERGAGRGSRYDTRPTLPFAGTARVVLSRVQDLMSVLASNPTHSRFRKHSDKHHAIDSTVPSVFWGSDSLNGML